MTKTERPPGVGLEPRDLRIVVLSDLGPGHFRFMTTTTTCYRISRDHEDDELELFETVFDSGKRVKNYGPVSSREAGIEMALEIERAN